LNSIFLGFFYDEVSSSFRALLTAGVGIYHHHHHLLVVMVVVLRRSGRLV